MTGLHWQTGGALILLFAKSSRAPNTAKHRANAEGIGLAIGFLKIIAEKQKDVKCHEKTRLSKRH